MNGHDDLASAVELDLIASALPEQRFFVWRLKAALVTRGEREWLRNHELRHARRFHPGATVSGAAKALELEWLRYLGASGSAERH